MGAVRWAKHRTALGRNGQRSWFAHVGDREVMIRRAKRNGLRFDSYRRTGRRGPFRAAPFGQRTFGSLRLAKDYGERWLNGAIEGVFRPDEVADPRGENERRHAA